MIAAKKKIFLVSHSAETSGAPKMLLNVAESLSQERFDLTLCFPEQKDLAIIAREKGFQVLIVENPQTGFREQKGLLTKAGILLSRLQFMRSIRQEVIRGGYDLVYLNSAGSIYAGLALIRCPVPIIWSLHEDLQPSLWNRFRRMAITRIASRIIFVSLYNLEFFKSSVTQDMYEILPYGIPMEQMEHFFVDHDYRARFQYKPGETLVGTASFISHRKGIDILLRAMELVFKERPDCKLVIGGDLDRAAPGYVKEIRDLSVQPPLRGKVFFPGYCDNIPSFLECLSLFVLASRNDPMPLAVLEAMAAGKAVVATDVGSLREMLDPPGAGLVVPPENPEALAREILSLLKNQGLREKMGQNARERVRQNYSMQVFRKRISQIIDKMMGSVEILED